jgi:hypothetical protein
MPFEEVADQLARPASRRSVVTTGAKLAYAAPLVAATMKLSAHGASASVSGPGSGTTAGITVCRNVRDNNGENTRQLVANQNYRVTHVPGGESAVFAAISGGFIDIIVQDCNGNPGQNFFDFQDIGSGVEITFFSYLPSNPAGDCVQGNGCFTLEAG